MSESKKIVIGTDLSGVERGFASVRRMLDGLKKEGIAASKVIGGLNVGGSHQMGLFAKSIATGSQRMKEFRNITTDTSAVMKNVWQRTLKDEQRSLDETSKRLERLNKMRKQNLELLNYSKSSGGSGERYQRKLDSIETRIAGTTATMMSRQDGVRELSGRSGIDNDKAIIATATAQAVAAAISGAAGTVQSIKNMDWSNASNVAGLQTGFMRSFAGGNFIQSDVLRNGRRDPFTGKNLTGAEFMSGAGGKWAGKAKLFGSGASQILDAAGNALTLGGAKGGGSGGGMVTDRSRIPQVGGSIATSLTGAASAGAQGLLGGPEALQAGSYMERLSAGVSMDPTRAMVYENLAATAGVRVAASRRLGNQHMRFAGFGAGKGLDLGESLAHGTSMAEQFGATHAPSVFTNSLELERFGLDRSKTGSMLGTMSFGNKDVSQSKKELEEIFSRGITRGLSPSNVQFFEAIGKAVADNSVGRGGTNSGMTAVGQALSFGLDRHSSMLDVQSNVSGLQGLDNINKNGYFRAASLENAKKILGPDADWASAQALGDASWGDLMSDKNQHLDNLGVSKGQRRQQLSSRGDTLLRTIMGEGKSSIGKRLKDSLEKTGSFSNALKDPKLRSAVASQMYETLKNDGNGFQSEQQALGALNIYSGAMEGTVTGGRLSQKFGDGTALSQKRGQAGIQQQIFGKEAEFNKNGEISKAIQDAGSFFEKLANLPTGLENAEHAVGALEDVYKVLKDISEVGTKAADRIKLINEQQRKAQVLDRKLFPSQGKL
jgi:hypothetical protein